MILSVINVNTSNAIECKALSLEEKVLNIFYDYHIIKITNILLFISILLGIIIIAKHKNIKPLVISFVTCIIAIFTHMKSMNNGGAFIEPTILETRIQLVLTIITIILELISFIYSTVKLVKYIKSDKFGKENKDVRDD